MSLRTTASTAFGWLGGAAYLILYLIRLVVVSFLYWMLGSLVTFVPLCILAVNFDLPNQSIWAWGLLIMPVIAGIGMIYWHRGRIKAEAASVALSKESIEEMVEGVRIIILGPIALLLTALAIGAGLLLLWGGYVLLAALPISVAIVVGAMLIALAIFAAKKVSV